MTKNREAQQSAGELTVPVARGVDAERQTAKLVDVVGMTAAEAQSEAYSRLYAASYQYACIKPPGGSSDRFGSGSRSPRAPSRRRQAAGAAEARAAARRPPRPPRDQPVLRRSRYCLALWRLPQTSIEHQWPERFLEWS